ncbi:MAG: hypothetical protein CUN54_10025, partial [Phototrophicales bacterium]
MPMQRPPMIRTDMSNPFANNTIRVRLPRIIEETLQLNPDYTAPIPTALRQLSDDLQSDAPISMLKLPAPDYDEWAAIYAHHAGETWQTSIWYFAEHYFYRLMMQAVRWWETQRDP